MRFATRNNFAAQRSFMLKDSRNHPSCLEEPHHMLKRAPAAQPCRYPAVSTSRNFIQLLLAIAALVSTAATLNAQPAAGKTRMLRSPTVSASQIAFAYANNIWTVPRAGGSAR